MGMVLLVVLAGAAGVVAREDGSAAVHTIALGTSLDALTVATRAGQVFISTHAGMTILDIRTGVILRTVPRGQSLTILGTDEHAERILAIDRASVRVFDARTGAVLHTVPTNMDPLAMVVDEQNGHAIAITAQGTTSAQVSVLDTRTGAILRAPAVDLAESPTVASAIAVDDQTGHVFVTSPDDDSVYMLDARSGAVLATNLVARSPSAVAVGVHSGRVFVASSGVKFCTGASPCGSGLSVLDARSGAVLSIQRLSTSPLAVAVDERSERLLMINGTSDNNGYSIGIMSISVLDARTGAVIRTVPVAANLNPATIAVDERHGRVFVTSQGSTDSTGAFMGPGRVYVLDAQSGALLRIISVGVAPIAAAVDEQTGNLCVINAGGIVRVPNGWGWVPAGLRGWLPFLPRPGATTRALPTSVCMLDTTL